jgi:hypothetical protein
LKQYALPLVHAEPLASNELNWGVIHSTEIAEYQANRDSAARAPSLIDAEGKLANVQRQAVSLLHACRSALITGIIRVADVERENKGKAS